MIKHVNEYYNDEHEARYVQVKRIYELDDKKELNKRLLTELKTKIEQKLKTVMSLKRIENKSTYNEGLETVNNVIETCQKLIDEIPAIKGKIQKVDEILKENETFMDDFKAKYVKLKPGIYE